MSKSNFFWVSYADLMTSLFFLMLVLYIVSFTIINGKQKSLAVQAEQLEKIKNVQKAIENIDQNYFSFDEKNKRYRLNIDVKFRSNSSSIDDLSQKTKNELLKAGKILYNQLQNIIKSNSEVDYLLIIEGNTQRSNNNYKNIPNVGYKLSYKRALSLYNFWKNNGYDFKTIGNRCEIILAGSGYFSNSRDKNNEENNRRFTLQVTSKIGKFLHEN